LSGRDVETSLKFANAVAALKCRDLGARTALPNEQTLTEFLSSANS
jgi:sugar/nucleoside kinase (ribokinase family)